MHRLIGSTVPVQPGLSIVAGARKGEGKTPAFVQDFVLPASQTNFPLLQWP